MQPGKRVFSESYIWEGGGIPVLSYRSTYFHARHAFESVTEALKQAGIEPQAAEVSMIPQNYVALTGNDARAMMKLYEAIDDNDDVQKVYANLDIDESEME